MIINLYFEEGPGSGDIGAMVANWVTLTAERLGVDTNRISVIGVATDESYETAVNHLFPSDGYTLNDAHKGVGKSHTSFAGPEPSHSVLFHSYVFELILRGMSETGSENHEDWATEYQLGPFIIAHELGHCRDNELHGWPSIEPLDFVKGFNLAVVHDYYASILTTEIGACLHGDRFYSRDFLFHIFENDSDALKKHKEQYGNEKSQEQPDQIFRVACIGSALAWLYIIQFAKIVVGKLGTSFEQEKIDQPFANLNGFQQYHSRIEEAVASFCGAFPENHEVFKDEIYDIWKRLCETLGLEFIEDAQG